MVEQQGHEQQSEQGEERLPDEGNVSERQKEVDESEHELLQMQGVVVVLLESVVALLDKPGHHSIVDEVEDH